MATKTRTGGGALALLLAVIVGAGFMYGLGQRSTRQRDSKGIPVSVIFKPSGSKRLTPVTVNVTVNGSPAYRNERTKDSPWTAVIPAFRGDTIVVTATQEVPATLSCAIFDQVQETTTFRGSVVCEHVVR